MILRSGLMIALTTWLASCAPAPDIDTATRNDPADLSLPPMKAFAPAPTRAADASNADLAEAFLALSFSLESGRTLPVMSRVEGPISLRVTGNPPPSLTRDLNALLRRLRQEAGIDITRTTSPNAQITIEALPRATLRSTLPQAACFVIPGVASLQEFRQARGTPRTDWTRLTERRKLAIFLPNDVSPQETRDCLHEELAQALGPLNDLYRLPDSVFNDDNVHSVLTGFDMLILRAYYHPALHSGMTRDQVASRLPAILSEINPAGDTRTARLPGPTPRAWSAAIQTALGPGAKPADRRAAVDKALRIAETAGWLDHRHAFAHYAAGRLYSGVDPAQANAHFLAADRLYARHPSTALHRAYVSAQLAAQALRRNDPVAALDRLDPALSVAAAHENAALLSTLQMLRAEALAQSGAFQQARRVRLDSLGWARYGFGPDWAVRAKANEVAALNPMNASSG